MPSSTITSPGHASCDASSLPSQSGIVIAFAPRPERRAHLTMRDRLSVLHWTAALPPGFDRLVIHARLPGDPPELGDMALVYRPSEPWAAWGFTRQGEAILTWNCVTGADGGHFAEMDEALEAVLRAG